MKSIDKDFLRGMLAFIVAIAFIAVVVIFLSLADKSIWNDGKCSCGGNWVYEQPVGHAYSTHYLYNCDECGKAYEFMSKR